MRPVSLAAIVLLAIAGTGGLAQAAKPKALPLHARELGSSPSKAQAFEARYAVVELANSVNVIDDLTGRRYLQGLPPECVVIALRVPEALLSCPGEFPPSYGGQEYDRPLILDLRDGRQIALPRGEPRGKSSNGLGYRPGIDHGYYRLGSQWIQGTHDTYEPNPIGTVYLNRFTGERRELQRSLGLDLDSPALSPKRRPRPCAGYRLPHVEHFDRRWLRPKRVRGRTHLFLARCGRRPQLVTRCPSQCHDWGLTRRFAVWAGEHHVVIHSIRTRRRFKLHLPSHNFSGDGGLFAATDRRVRISLPRSSPSGSRNFRILEVRLPRVLR